MEDIIITMVLDKEGAFHHLELHQDGQKIKLSLASKELDVQTHSYKWAVLKQQIDDIQESLQPKEKETEDGK